MSPRSVPNQSIDLRVLSNNQAVRLNNPNLESAVKKVRKDEVTLGLKADLTLLSLATSFVEKAALAFGLAEADALSLTLASEEIFAYLCQAAVTEQEVQMRCRRGIYFVELELVFQAQVFDIKSFNLTSSVTFDDTSQVDETGLLIASRMVEGFQFFRDDEGFRLILTKEKTYPTITDLSVPEIRSLEEYTIRTPNADELKLFIRMVNAHSRSYVIHPSFAFPGKVVDMVAGGEYDAAVAFERTGQIGGGIIWHFQSPRLVEFYGPYLFIQPPKAGMAHALIDSCLRSVARSGALGLISRFTTPDLPKEYFECLGSLTVLREGGQQVETQSYYRHLEEDMGLAVWAHPLFEAFLVAEYDRLFFARDIRWIRHEGESVGDSTVLSAHIERGVSWVSLCPVWWGPDAEQILAAHLQAFEKEKILNIFFEMDLGESWQCYFTPVLIQLGFQPRLVIPYAGKGDHAIFQYKAGTVD